jgi:alkylation response protein AidB-like acyl-CoA dehydrogenase
MSANKLAATTTAQAGWSLEGVFTEEHELFRETCRRFFAKELEPNYVRWEKEGQGTPADFWRKAGELGLVGMAIPPEYGGPGGNFLFNVIQNEELGRFVGGASVGAAIATDVMTNILIEHGTHEQKQRWCPGILEGSVIQALGLTEPGSGSDVVSIQTRAGKAGGDYLINGNKCYMSSGAKANLLYVVAKTDGDLQRGRGAMTLFLVDTRTPGVTQRRMDTLGMRASSTGEAFFSDVRVPADCMLGNEGEALRGVLKGTFTLDRTLISTRALATAELAFGLTLEYVKNRKVFGQPVFEFQNTQFKLAEMKTELVVGAAFRESLLRQLVSGRLDVLTATTAKLWFSEMVYRTADTCLQLHGGFGYMTESAISRIYTASRVEPIYGGTSEIQKVNIAKSLR